MENVFTMFLFVKIFLVFEHMEGLFTVFSFFVKVMVVLVLTCVDPPLPLKKSGKGASVSPSLTFLGEGVDVHVLCYCGKESCLS